MTIPDYLRMKIYESDGEKVRRIKNYWNRFVVIFWFIFLSFILGWVLIDAKIKSTGDNYWGYFLWIMIFVWPVFFGILMAYYGYKITDKKRNLLYGLLSYFWIPFLIGIFIGYFVIFGTVKQELNKLK